MLELLKELGAFAPFATALVVAVTFWKSMQVHRRLKQQDVMAAFHKRYEEVRFDMLLKAQKGEVPPEAFFLRFWNLQIDQYKAWQFGFIPDDVYLDHWLNERRAEMSTPPVNGMSWLEGWDHAKQIMGHKPFCEFMNRVLRGTVADAVAFARGRKK